MYNNKNIDICFNNGIIVYVKKGEKMENAKQINEASNTDLEKEEIKIDNEVNEAPAKLSLCDRLKYAIAGLILFLSLPISNIAYVFKPLYKRVYYGQSNIMFYYGIASAVMFIIYCLVKFLYCKKLNIVFKKDKTPLSTKMVIIIFAITFAVVFIISAILGFHVKPFYDLGNNTTGFKLYVQGVRHIYYGFLIWQIVNMIQFFQYALDDIIPFKNMKINKYIPYGGIVTMLTYGTYAWITGIGTLHALFFFMILVYGELYLLSKRNLLSTFASTAIIFIF